MRASNHLPLRSQAGFAMVTAIFILLMLAGLAAFVVNVTATLHTTAAQDLQGSRGYRAARAGVEWGVYRVLRDDSCAASTPLTLGGTLAEFAVTVTCESPVGWSYTEGANSVALYRITATASQGAVGGSGYVERQVQATVSK